MSTPRRLVKSILSVRDDVEGRIAKRDGILGSMVGMKFQGGKPTGQTGLTFLVRKKLPKDQLPIGTRVPSRLKTRNGYIATDVLVWPRMREQAGLPPDMVTDWDKVGTLTCFASSGDAYFGVTCAHSILGADGNPATSTPVAYYENRELDWVPCGDSGYAAYAQGTGQPGNFGFYDCGLIYITDPQWERRARAARPVRTVSDASTLYQQRLIGFSPLDFGVGPQRTATVIGVETWALDRYCDLVLRVDEPGTYYGDSGMLWMTRDGRAAAIHTEGELLPTSIGSKLTTAMLASRACEILGVEFLLPK